MPRQPRISPLELTLRFLMIAVCALPLAGLRQVAAALPPGPVPAPIGQLPTAPLSEEEENERAEEVKNRVGQRAEHRPDPPRTAPRLPAATSAATARAISSGCPSPADPFRNGLGSPYRC
jgi:hypothetical protein